MRFIIPGDPRGLARPRFRAQPRGKGLGVRLRGELLYRLGDVLCTAYDSATSKADRAHVTAHLREGFGDRAPLECAIDVNIVACFAWPKSKHRKREPREAEWHLKKPDADNIAKLVLDCATGIVFRDDTQVVDLHVVKIILPQGVESRTIVEVRETEHDPGFFAMNVLAQLEGVTT